MDRIFFSGEPKRKRGGRANLGVAEARSYEGPDLISRLPNEVLGAIVTLLDTDEGARTSVLSRRWRHIWRDAAPLNLDDESLYSSLCWGDERHPVISRIIAAHPGPARRLALRSIALSPYVGHYDAWLRLPVFDSIQELSLHFPVTHHHPVMPASALRFASLRVLDINNCTFPASGSSLVFPCLTHLSLSHVGITEEHLHGIISNSPGIEAISLDTNFGYRRLCISLPKLRYLSISDRSFREREELNEVVVGDAASLERLLLHEMGNGPSVRITGAAKLKILGYLGTGFPDVVLGNTSFKCLVPVSLVEQFSTVKILALEIPEAPKLKVVTGYLRCFPCVEKLHIMFFVNKWRRSLKGIAPFVSSTPIECLDRSLKTIVLQHYSGRKLHLEFAKFFVERAKVLEVMKFCTTAGVTPKWLENQCKRLNIMERASTCAQFPFVLQGHLPLRFWMDGAFSSDDPFMCD